jgi:hypothetical protein
MKILNKWRNYKNMRIKQKEQEMMKKLTIDQKGLENLDNDVEQIKTSPPRVHEL